MRGTISTGLSRASSGYTPKRNSDHIVIKYRLSGCGVWVYYYMLSELIEVPKELAGSSEELL